MVQKGEQKMNLEFDNDRPIYLQIYEVMKMDIMSGHYKEGEKLPSVRELASYYRVNPNTMQRAFGELENASLVYTERTNGRFVTKDRESIANVRKEIALEKITSFLEAMDRLGFPDEEVFTFIEEIRKGE